jgi:hypothetical protein
MKDARDRQRDCLGQESGGLRSRPRTKASERNKNTLTCETEENEVICKYKAILLQKKVNGSSTNLSRKLIY